MTISDAEELNANVMYFQNRYITTGFEFGDKQINVSDPEKNMDFLLRKRTPEDAPPNDKPLEAGDGFVTVTCKREMTKRIYDGAVSSGQLSIRNGAVGSISHEMYKYVLRTMRLIRWRTNCRGRPNPIRSALFDGLKWSLDGVEWKPVADYISFKASVTVNPRWTSEAEQFVIAQTSGELDEPLGHELLREAWANRSENRRSSIVLAVAAAEVGFKQFASKAFPDAAWILENVPSPPLVKMLTKFFPWSKLNLQINGTVATPPDSVTTELEKAVLLRNEIVHGRGEGLKEQTVDSVLTAVRDLLYFLDALQGQGWALSYLSSGARQSLTPKKIDGTAA
jgi:hypothetical protein